MAPPLSSEKQATSLLDALELSANTSHGLRRARSKHVTHRPQFDPDSLRIITATRSSLKMKSFCPIQELCGRANPYDQRPRNYQKASARLARQVPLCKEIKGSLAQGFNLLLSITGNMQQVTRLDHEGKLVQNQFPTGWSLSDPLPSHLIGDPTTTNELEPDQVTTVTSTHYPCFYLSVKGRRQELEDTVVADKLQLRSDTFSVYALFDGHSGTEASNWLQDNFKSFMEHALQDYENELDIDLDKMEDYQIEQALIRSVVAMREQLYLNLKTKSGSTLQFLLVLNGRYCIVNLGDSRALKTVPTQSSYDEQLTEDASLDIARYAKAVEKRNNQVIDGRINGILAVAKAISPIPNIPTRPLVGVRRIGNNEIIFMGCDGAFETMSSIQATEYIHESLNAGSDLKDIVQKLTRYSIRSGSLDNVTLMAIDLQKHASVA